ncbi:MAG: hypothetical protein SWK90_11440 [Chloroflexota bacterium]|nr:hypothetical protein [Chloroflexota bacterium]
MTADPETLAARRLSAAVVLRACRDATAADPEQAAPAREWLADEGADLAEQLGLSPERVTGWLAELGPVRQPGLPGLRGVTGNIRRVNELAPATPDQRAAGSYRAGRFADVGGGGAGENAQRSCAKP